MSINPRCFGLSQVTNLVANLSKKNLKGNTNELAGLLEKHGSEAEKHLFRCLLNAVDFSQVDSKGGGGGSGGGKDIQQQLQLLMLEAANIISKPNFVSVLCYGFEKLENKTLRPVSQLLPTVSKALRLTKVQEVVFALALTNCNETELRQHASHHLRIKLSDLVRSYSDLSSGFEGGLSDVAIEGLHLLLSYLLQHSEEEIGIPQDTLEAFISILRRDFPRDRVPVVLAPLLYRHDQDITEDRLVPVSVSLPDTVASLELAEIICDVGFAASASKHDMLEILKDYGKANITPAVIARVLGMMAQTSHSNSLVDSVPYVSTSGDSGRPVSKSVTFWDSKVLAAALQSLVPNLCWRDVVPEMDYEGFHLSSPEGLSIIMTAYSAGSKDPFPIDMIYGPWVHTPGQLSWFQQALAGCPDFSFAAFPFNSVNIEPLKNSYLNDEAKTWRSLSLIETLLNLAEQGHYSEVMSLFKVPIKQCPEVFFLGLLQCKTNWQVLQMEMLSHLIPMFFTNHPNSSNILNFVWHSQVGTQNVQSMLIQAMSDWYIQGESPDHTRLLRILDVAQDLKMLPVMLKGNQFPFVIDLACWASKRKFLKLDIWMVEKIKEHQEPFVNECILFLVNRASKPVHHGAPETSGLSHDTVSTMLGCIQPFISSLKPEFAQKLKMLISFHGPVAPAPRPPNPLGLPPVMNQMEYGVGCIGSPISSGNGGYGGNMNPPGSPGKSNIGVSGFPSGGQPSMFAESPFGKQSMMMQQQQQQPQQPPQQLPTPIRGGDNADPLLSHVMEQPSKEVDEKANAYFQAIYNGRMTVDLLLEILKQFKDSSIKKEKDLFVCMLKNIFEEYKFFPQFPEKELRITGQLFGGIIEHGLVTLMSRNLALKFIFDALKKPPSGKMHLFGLAALEKCRKRLKEFPQFCASVAVIPHFQSFPAHLREFVQYGQQAMEPPSSTACLPPFGPDMLGNVLTEPPPPSTVTTKPHSGSSLPTFSRSVSIGGTTGSDMLSPMSNRSDLSPTIKIPSSQSKPAGSPSGSKKDQPLSINITNLDTLLGAAEHGSEKKNPSEELQDKVHFLFNNLSPSTLQQKVDEFKEIFDEEYYDWLAQYLVMKRASIEANYHPLYLSFMDTLNSTKLNKSVLRETYRNIKVILQSDKTSDNFSDRAILKNLGKWLGMQTVGKNKPILHVDLSVKYLLLEGYYRGGQDLLYVVPFVAKVLEACADSKVFKPPNPWVMAIMSVLAELHAVPDLKLNLKFEVEVLCKHLSLEISELKKSNFLKDHERAKTLFELVGPKEKAGNSTTSPPQALYMYEDIPSSLSGIGPLIRIDPQISLLQQYPHLKTYIKNAIEKAIQDLLVPVAERSAKIALTTTENIVKKDFALDPEVVRMHTASAHMVRNLTAGMAMITCREPLLLSITSNLRSAFSSVLRVRDMNEHPANDDQLKQMIDHAAHHLSADNTELACAFIQKTAVEKVVPEMEKRLAEEFELRHMARSERKQYYNAAALQYQVEQMPEQLRVSVGGPSSQQGVVYEEFSRCLPGFLPSRKFVPSEEFMMMMNNCVKEITNQIRSVLAPPTNPHVVLMRSLLEITGVLRANPEYANVIALLEKALEGLLEGMNPPPSDPDMFVSFRDCHILILKALQDQRALGPNAACRLVTKMLMETREDIKYSPRALILLIGLQLVDMKQLDEFLAKAVESGRNLVALSCSIKLVTAIISAEKRDTPITDSDLKKTKETLFRLASNVRQLPESTAQLLEPFCRENDIRVSVLGPDIDNRHTSMHPNMMHQAATTPTTGTGGELEDPPGLYEKVEYLLSEWVRHFHQPGLMRDGDKVYAAYVARLQQQGILKNDDLIQRFFRISMEMCVELCYRTLNDPMSAGMSRPKCYHTMDAFVKLVVVLVRYSGEPTNTLAKVNLLNKVLVTVTQVLLHDHEKRQLEFHQLPYHRFFIMLLNDLCTPDPVFDAINFHVLQCFSAAYHTVRPAKAPGFSYAWLELISHRVFVAKLLLQTTQQKGWPLFHQLLIDLFRFLSPFLRNAELLKATQTLYKGTLRVLLVLLHDFPEFLCDYHFSFCDVIPPNCIQMRNLILSAFPRNMRLPDPFTPNLKVELLPDIQNAPRVLTQYVQIIPPTLKKELDNYIKTRAPVTFLQELRSNLQVSSEPGKQYNVSLINALVLFVGTQAIAYIHSKSGTPSTSAIAHTAHMDIFQHLVVDLDTEGRYLFLNAIANQLRYPNSHTHFFSCALLSLFAETNHEAIQEQITRVLLERLIVNRPHPWGLLITFIDLIKNPTYNFWKHDFVHCAPEIEKLFESVAKSCMQKQPPTTTSSSTVTRDPETKEQ